MGSVEKGKMILSIPQKTSMVDFPVSKHRSIYAPWPPPLNCRSFGAHLSASWRRIAWSRADAWHGEGSILAGRYVHRVDECAATGHELELVSNIDKGM